MENADLSAMDHPNGGSLSNESNPMSACLPPQNQPATCPDCLVECSKWIPKPKTLVETIKLQCKLIYERRNMVKMPAISTASFPLFLESLLACLLYVVTFRRTAWYRLSGELIQQRAEATLHLLKAAALPIACSGHRPADLMMVRLSLLGRRPCAKHYVDEWNIFEFTSLREHWRHFLCGRDWDALPYLIQVAGSCSFTLNIALQRGSGASLVCALYCFVTGFNYVATSIAYHRRFLDLGSPHHGFEWVNALSPKPSVGIWWEIELMAMPSMWFAIMHLAVYFSALSNTEDVGPFTAKLASPVWYVLAGLLFVFGFSHAAYIMCTTKRDIEAIEKSWQRRIDGRIFEQQYAIPALLPSRNQGLVIEAM